MISLDDVERWSKLRSSVGTGELARQLLADMRAGTGFDWAELYEQACHQTTVSEVAYAVVPEAIAIAENLPLRERLGALHIAGTVVASNAIAPQYMPPVPSDLKDAFERSLGEARRMATACLEGESWSRGEASLLLGVVAAFQGLHNVAMHMFMHGGVDDDLHCPHCGEYIRYDDA